VAGDEAIRPTNLVVNVGDDYVDLSALYICGGPASTLLLGPGATGTGKTPFTIAFPHLSAF